MLPKAKPEAAIQNCRHCNGVIPNQEPEQSKGSQSGFQPQLKANNVHYRLQFIAAWKLDLYYSSKEVKTCHDCMTLPRDMRWTDDGD